MRPDRVLLLLRPAIAAIALAVLLGLVTSAPARADLRVCNKTRSVVSIALGYRAERVWKTEFWWVAGAGDCAIVYRGQLNARYYYLFAADDINGGAWDGKHYMCTEDQRNTIVGTEDCLARGFDRTGFFEIDTQNRGDWTVELAEKNQSSPGTEPDSQ